MARRTPAERAVEAADALTAWLDGFVAPPRPEATPAGAGTAVTEADGAGQGADGEDGRAALHPGRPRAHSDAADIAGTCEDTGAAGAVLRLANPDWLEHHLVVSGPAEEIARFRTAASGPGVIPWHADLDGAEEDFFHLLVAPPAPHRRVLSAAGARIVAAELRNAMQRQRASALAELARGGRACPFDLHALLPVPDGVLALGPDHADALAWLWAHWGTTRGLRRVEVVPAPRSRVRLPEGAPSGPGQEALHLGFWSADWTPWRALARLTELWPTLRFQVCPLYDREGA